MISRLEQQLRCSSHGYRSNQQAGFAWSCTASCWSVWQGNLYGHTWWKCKRKVCYLMHSFHHQNFLFYMQLSVDFKIAYFHYIHCLLFLISSWLTFHSQLEIALNLVNLTWHATFSCQSQITFPKLVVFLFSCSVGFWEFFARSWG